MNTIIAGILSLHAVAILFLLGTGERGYPLTTALLLSFALSSAWMIVVAERIAAPSKAGTPTLKTKAAAVIVYATIVTIYFAV